MKNKTIIPILYLPGTGGHFLMNFITYAKLNVSTHINISEHGNAHNNASEIYVVDNFDNLDTSSKIQSILSLSHPNTISPYFCACHINEVDEVLLYFDKVIRISIDYDDIDEISHSYFGKWFIDRKEFKSDLADVLRIKHKIFTKTNSYRGLVRLFNDKENTSLLTISWKELVHDDVNDLVRKISEFVNINREQFTMQNLIDWRLATKNGIEEIQTLLNVAK
jgi:hypothetical protein